MIDRYRRYKLKDLEVIEELIKEIKSSVSNIGEVAQRENLDIQAAGSHMTNLRQNLIKALTASEDPSVDKFSICLDVLLLEFNSYLVGHSRMNQTLGKLATLDQMEKYLETKVATIRDEEKAADRILNAAEGDIEKVSERRRPGEHPEKIRNVRKLKSKLSETDVS